MSIFCIILFAFLIAGLVGCIGALIASCVYNEDLAYGITIALAVVTLIAGIFVGIGLNTESAQVWTAEFKAQKTTIEQSLKSEVLSGLERIELVNKAAELNGELAKRKAQSELWHYVYYDNNVYKNIEPIVIQ